MAGKSTCAPIGRYELISLPFLPRTDINGGTDPISRVRGTTRLADPRTVLSNSDGIVPLCPLERKLPDFFAYQFYLALVRLFWLARR